MNPKTTMQLSATPPAAKAKAAAKAKTTPKKLAKLTPAVLKASGADDALQQIIRQRQAQGLGLDIPDILESLEDRLGSNMVNTHKAGLITLIKQLKDRAPPAGAPAAVSG